MGRVVCVVVVCALTGCGLTLDLTPPEDAAGLDGGTFDSGRRDAARDVGNDVAFDVPRVDADVPPSDASLTDGPLLDAMTADAVRPLDADPILGLVVTGVDILPYSGVAFEMRDGPEQLRPYPWSTRDLKVYFSDPLLLEVPGEQVYLIGDTGDVTTTARLVAGAPEIAIMSSERLPDGRYCLVVRDTIERASDFSRLDGEWTSPLIERRGDTFPSGNGRPLGDFEFPFAILFGDVDGSGEVDMTDLDLVTAEIRAGPASSPIFDVNGDGVVSVTDAVNVSNRVGNSLADRPYPAPCNPG